MAGADIYDPGTQAWNPTAALSETRAFHAAALLPDGRVLVSGGWGNLGTPLASAELYDPAPGVWKPAAALRAARAGHVAVTLPDGRVLVVAGCRSGQDVVSDAELYEPAADVWQSAGELTAGRCWHTATLLADGRVLVVGGRDRNGLALASVELYDPTQNTWTSAAPLATPRLNHTATRLSDGRVLVVGGYNGTYLASAEVYDPAANAWTATGDLSAARAYHAAVLLRSGEVLVTGGSAGSRAGLETETYDPSTGAWTLAGALPASYEANLATLLNDGSVLITGRAGSASPSEDYGAHNPVPQATLRPPSGPTPTPSGSSKSTNSATWHADADTLAPDAFDAMKQAVAASQAINPTSNYTAGNAARLFGVHEVSLVRARPTDPAYNPYAITVTVAFTPQLATDDSKIVMAFYDGLVQENGPDENWKARVYVNRLGTWEWAVPPGFVSAGSVITFTAIEAATSGLHGMLRVSSESPTVASGPTPQATYTESLATQVGTPKRWYTDDGHTFLPMADTAYRLFFQLPSSTPSLPTECPQRTSIDDGKEFIKDYVNALKPYGINVLRVEALGNWAYSNRAKCEADLSLFWSDDKDGGGANLFDGSPSEAELNSSSSYYPNLDSFKRIDEMLTLLLDNFPDMFLQMMLIPEPNSTKWDHSWLPRPLVTTITPIQPASPGIPADLRMQIWRAMAARWAAFPNVYWSVSSDLNDTKINNEDLANEIGEYLSGMTSSNPLPDPWHEQRPISLGHLRNREDSFKAVSWHNYITAYSAADISAQQMDSSVALPEGPCAGNPPQAGVYWYKTLVKPTFNVEDYYEDQVTHPGYYYRRLFWSYLLSGGGATYGAVPTYEGTETYTTALLTGLDDMSYITDTLHAEGIDLSLFEPADGLVTMATPTGAPADWEQYNRPQVARHGKQNLIVYIPNAADSSSLYCQDRLNAAPRATPAEVTVNLATFTDANYAVTWFRPYTATGVTPPPMIFVGEQISGSASHNLTAPEGLTGDAILHISSRCQEPNACLPMDNVNLRLPSNYIGRRFGGFQARQDTASLNLDTVQRIFSGQTITNTERASWRCDRPPGTAEDGGVGCLLYYIFPTEKPIVSADYYFRRNSNAGHQSISLMTSPSITLPITYSIQGWPASTVDVGFNPEGDIFSDQAEWGSPVSLNVRHGVPLSSNRWYHLEVKATKKGDVDDRSLEVEALLDGVSVFTSTEKFQSGDQFLRGVVLHSAWWGPINDLDSTIPITPSISWDELAIGFPPDEDLRGLYRTSFQQGLGNYTGSNATYFDGTGGHNSSPFLHVGANDYVKSLLRFDVSSIPTNAMIDEASLELYYTGRSNGNSLTLGAHGVLQDWIDGETNRVQRKSGVNWNVAGMGSGSDYAATPVDTIDVTGGGGAWVNLDITSLAQAWVNNPASNLGLALRQAAASGYVTYDFCSDVSQQPSDPQPTPCLAGHTPKLTVRYHLVDPAPVKATFQRGAGGYAGNAATYFDGAAGYNNATYLRVGAANVMKALLRFDLAGIATGATIDEATLRIFQAERSNANTLTLAAQRVSADWIDAEANKTRRKTGVNWIVSGMGPGDDYLAEPDGTAALASAGGSWVELDVTQMVEAWVANSADNHGLVLTQEAASGSVYYSFCSELGWSPCTAAQAPQLTVWYH